MGMVVAQRDHLPNNGRMSDTSIRHDSVHLQMVNLRTTLTTATTILLIRKQIIEYFTFHRFEFRIGQLNKQSSNTVTY